MALHDVDKSGDRRDTPQPNHTDHLAQRLANAVTSLNPVTEDVTGVFATPTKGTLQLIATDVTSIQTFTTAANDFNSGTVQITYPTAIGTPIVLAFTKTGSSGGYSILWQGTSPDSVYSSTLSTPGGFQVLVRYLTFLDNGGPGTIAFTVDVFNYTSSPIGGTGGTYPIRYYIFKETAS